MVKSPVGSSGLPSLKGESTFMFFKLMTPEGAKQTMEAIVMQALGEEGFGALTAAFYRRVRPDDLIGPMYPDNDWEGSEERLRDFLLFRFGGSDRYLTQRGHPRLRMRHQPFRIGELERDRWLELMNAAMDEIALGGEARSHLTAFFAQVADFMRNQPEASSS